MPRRVKETTYSKFLNILVLLRYASKPKDIGPYTDQELFEALIQRWGFKKKQRKTPDLAKQQYIVEVDNEEPEGKLYVYTLSGGPMVIFNDKGEFVELA